MKAPFAIETVMALIHEKIKGLKDSPFKGEIYGEYESGTLRETLAGRFRIFFVIDEDAYRVDILRIWHSSRDEPDFED
jgi:plasmid stabilization system protein ParE